MAESRPFWIKNCQGITYLKPHIFYCSNNLANWHDLQGSNDLANRHDLQDIKHIKANIMADGRLFEFDQVEIFQCISLPETAYLVL